MSDQTEQADKSFEATPQKLLEARKKGDIARSTEILTAFAYAGLLVAFLATGSGGLVHLGTTMMVLIDQPAQLAPLFFDGAAGAPTGGLIRSVAWSMSPFFGFPALAVLLCLFAMRGIVFAPNKVAPTLSNISVISNAKNKFGRRGLFQFAVSFAKLLIYSACLAVFIHVRLDEMVSILQTNPRLVVSLLAEICLSFLLVVVIVSAVIGVIDSIWQHFEHLRRNMMSRKEIMDETKNAEGDPHMKQERRQRAQAIAGAQMMADVPKADVIIVNPTHYSVALKWDRKPGQAPVCVAKGVDEIALRIREIAEENDVPIRSDPPTARALHATTGIGDEIAPDHYRAVAAAIRFAEAMRQRAKGRI
ncbi:flagellar type III secretion system protein FlhB [Roseobacter sinensis]|uniref:Flagellar type III secretion system protein FlhB n=1 Tax=Roseobacter sinensis TaxID=2931391 RepID=A0ABT3B8V8_9RHOB|nr:flagellar type III secretion system protein FlhB [Roseobacter sp. WL0113]MCV3269874.1 flagellar type III secretion system protein FlhB [Roseobacter sp. WL0113]